ncbi:MAG: hypothetical protein SFV54_20035 [Bryobacteraceae bacterium]|nr:hypothetical protein [Bryobacteraceae bacterium]
MYRLAAFACLLLLLYSLATMIQLLVLGGQPASAAEAFRLLQENRVVGLLRLDLPTILAMPLYYVVFLALFAALNRTARWQSVLFALLGFAGVTLCLATPTALSLLPLSDKHAAAGTAEARAALEAAGEALLASDIWHGTGAFMGALLLQTGMLVSSMLMLSSKEFGKATAWVGVVTHGLDLVHVAATFLLPAASVVLMAVAGPLYLVWFPLIGLSFLRLERTCLPNASSPAWT